MSDKMRLDRFLSNMGMGSRNEVRRAIKYGRVRVDGETVREPSFYIEPGIQTVTVNSAVVEFKPHIYLMMNKPKGYLSASFDKKAPTVMDLLPEPYSKMKLFVAGRLDKDTTGLLILTDDGDFAHRMLSPKKHVFKTYEAVVERPVTPADTAAFGEGVRIEGGYITKPAVVEPLETKDGRFAALVSIREGRFHQIKQMFHAVGSGVLELRRVKIGGLRLSGLKEGEVRELSKDETELIFGENG